METMTATMDRVEVERSVLASALAVVKRSGPRRDAVAVLARMPWGSFRVGGGDHASSVRVELAAVEDDGSEWTVPAVVDLAAFVPLIKGRGKGTVSIEVDHAARVVTVRNGATVGTVSMIDAAEVGVSRPAPMTAPVVPVDAPRFAMAREAVEAVASVASRDEGRPILAGVHAAPGGAGRVILTGTDAYRLVRRSASAHGGDLATVGDVIIPAAMLREVARVAGADDIIEFAVVVSSRLAESMTRPGEVVVEGPVVRAMVGGFTFAARTITGEFPNIERIIPARSPEFSGPSIPGAVFDLYGSAVAEFARTVGKPRNGAVVRFTVGPWGALTASTVDLAGSSAPAVVSAVVGDVVAGEVEDAFGWTLEYLADAVAAACADGATHARLTIPARSAPGPSIVGPSPLDPWDGVEGLAPLGAGFTLLMPARIR